MFLLSRVLMMSQTAVAASQVEMGRYVNGSFVNGQFQSIPVTTRRYNRTRASSPRSITHLHTHQHQHVETTSSHQVSRTRLRSVAANPRGTHHVLRVNGEGAQK